MCIYVCAWTNEGFPSGLQCCASAQAAERGEPIVLTVQDLQIFAIGKINGRKIIVTTIKVSQSRTPVQEQFVAHIVLRTI